MKLEPVLAPSPPSPHPACMLGRGLTQSARQRDRQLSISRFAAWQRQTPSSTAILVRLLRLLAR